MGKMADNDFFGGVFLDPHGNGARPSSQDTDINSLSLNVQKRVRYRQDTRFRKHLTRWVMWIVPA